MGQRDVSGTGQAGAASDDGCSGGGVVRRAQRWPGDESMGGVEGAGHGVDGGDGDGVGALQGRQDRGQTLGEHGLPCARRPHHDEVVAPGRGDLKGSPGFGLPDDIGQVRWLAVLGGGWIGVVVQLGDLLHSGGHGRAQTPAVAVHELTDMADGGDPGAGDQFGLGGRLPGDDDLFHPGGDRGLDAGQDTAHRVHRAVQPELADVHGASQETGRGAPEPPAGAQDGQRERQVQSGARLAQIRRGEVDGQALLSPCDTAGAQGRTDALARFSYSGVGQADEGEAGQALDGVGLDVDDVSGQPGQGDRECVC